MHPHPQRPRPARRITALVTVAGLAAGILTMTATVTTASAATTAAPAAAAAASAPERAAIGAAAAAASAPERAATGTAATPAPAPTARAAAPAHLTSPAVVRFGVVRDSAPHRTTHPGAPPTAPRAPVAARPPAGALATVSAFTGLRTAVAAAAGTGSPGTFSLGAATVDLLGKTLHIPVGDGELVGSVDGRTFTATVSGPTMPPIAIPGADALTFGDTSISIDTSSKRLTLSTSARSGSTTGTLTVSIPDVTGATTGVDIEWKLAGVPVLGVPTDFDGHLAVTNGTLDGSLTATLAGDAPIPGSPLTLKAGSTFTVDRTNGLTAHATADVAGVEFAVSGAISGPRDWSLTVDSTGASWDVGAGLTFAPNFHGQLTATAGKIGFDLRADNALSWKTSGPTFAITTIEIANVAPPADAQCPASTVDGTPWFRASGTMNVEGATIDAAACVNLSDRSFHLSSAVDAHTVNLGIATLDHLALDLRGSTTASSLQLRLNGQIHVKGVGIEAGLAYRQNQLVVAGRITNPTALGFGPDDTGVVYAATTAVDSFPLDALFPGETGTVTLKAGVTAKLAFHLPQPLQSALAQAGLGTTTTVDVSASFTSDGFDLSGTLVFGGVHIGNATTYLEVNSLGLELHVAPTTATVTLSGTSTLHLPALLAGTSPTTPQVTLSATFALSANPSITLGITIKGENGGRWTNAFGIGGLNVGALSASVTIAAVPAFSFSASNVTLPASIANPIGLNPNAPISLQFSSDPASPMLVLSITGTGSPRWALKPLTITSNDATVQNAIVVTDAAIRIAPAGGRIGSEVVPAGIQVKFGAVILGTTVTVNAQLNPAAATLHADIAMGTVNIGPNVSLPGAQLAVDIAPTGAKFLLQGSFVDGTTNTRFNAAVKLSATAQLANAGISLTVVSGLPAYLQVNAALNGTVSLGSGGLSFSVSGNGSIVVAGQYLGAASFSYSSQLGSVWSQISGSAQSVAAAMRNAWGWTSTMVSGALRGLKWDQFSMTNALSSAGFTDFVQSINNFFHPSARYIWNKDAQVLDVEYASLAVNARVVQWPINFGANQKWVWTPLPSSDPAYALGYGEWVNVNSGMCLSVVSGSTVAGANVVQAPCIGHDSQLWRGEDAGGGYSWLKNRNTGYVLDLYQGSLWPQTPFVQWYKNYSAPGNQMFYTTGAII